MKDTYHRHSRHQTVKGSALSGGQKKFNGSDVIIGALGIDCAEGNGRCNKRNEHEEGDGNRFGIEIGHFPAPMSGDDLS
jgi:hypothetical protein